MGGSHLSEKRARLGEGRQSDFEEEVVSKLSTWCGEPTTWNTKKKVIEMFKNCVEEEKAWARHLFKDGSIIGLNEKLLGQYVEWIANKRLRALGYDPLYDIPASQNPLMAYGNC